MVKIDENQKGNVIGSWEFYVSEKDDIDNRV